MKRPELKYPDLCFVCQENKPAYKVIRDNETFNCCGSCNDLVMSTNKAENRIKQAIHLNDSRHIFEYTLGANLLPVRIKSEQL